MFENRNLHRDLFTIILVVAAIFLGISLFTFNPNDVIPGTINSSNGLVADSEIASEDIKNGCGVFGALISNFALSAFGYGAFYIFASIIGLAIWNIRQSEFDSPILRVLGWGLSLIGVLAIASVLFPDLRPSGLSGSGVGGGGTLGSAVSTTLQRHFATAGSVILAFSVTVAGILLFSDYAILRSLRWVAAAFKFATDKVTNRSNNLDRPLSSKSAKGNSPTKAELLAASQLDEDEYESDEDELEEDDRHYTIKIRGRGQESEDEEDFEDESDYESEEEYEEEEFEDEVEAEDDQDEPVSTVPISSKPHFSIKRPKKGDKKSEDDVRHKLDAASLVNHDIDYQLPAIEMLSEGGGVPYEQQERECRNKARLLEKTFNQFGFNVKVVEIETGPVIAQYEIELEAGLRLSKITGLADDIAIALRVPSVRIVAPIPGKNTVGIEIPNETRQVVQLRDVMEESSSETRSMKIPLFLGKDVSGNPLVADLAKLPHLLIAGRTGTGKSVCLNAIISSILMTRRPDEVRMLMIDPKMVELSGYGRLPHLMHPVVTDMRKAEAILAWAVDKMEERYALLARAGVRHVTSYNQLDEEELMDRMGIEEEHEMTLIPKNLPFIVIIADEMADLMMTAGKEVEAHIIRLAQKSRAVGIHLILATQKPTVDVITGLIKSNLPARISFQVASRTDSRVVLDENGADKLLGNGDMLFLGAGSSTLMRGQGTYLSDDEIESITDVVSTGEQNFVNELVNLKIEEEAEEPKEVKNRDELYEDAIDVIVGEGRGSLSLLQRALGIGYGRAARLVDFMAEDGIVGPYNGSKSREVLVSPEQWQTMKSGSNDDEGDNGDDDPEDFDPPPRSKKPRKTKRRQAAAAPALEYSQTDSATVLNSSKAKKVKLDVFDESEADVSDDDEYENEEFDPETEDEEQFDAVSEDEEYEYVDVEDDEDEVSDDDEYEDAEYEDAEYEDDDDYEDAYDDDDDEYEESA